MKKIRVGIIGQGRSGRNIHAVSLLTPKLREKYQIAAVVDYIAERTNETVAESKGCIAYTDYREMLKDKSLDLIINASFSNEHAPISLACLEAGFNVLSDKPIARNVKMVDKLISTAKKSGKMFAIFQQSLLNATFCKVLEVKESGVLGRIVQIKASANGFARRWDWQTLQERDGGSLLNTGPHPLGQSLRLFGNVDPEKIVCIMDRVNTFGDAEDHVKLLLTRQGYPTVDLEISACSMFTNHSFQLYGQYGCLTATPSKVEWKYFVPEEAEEQKLIPTPLPDRAYCSENLQFHVESWTGSEISKQFNFPTELFYDKFYDTMMHGKPAPVTIEEVRRQIMIIEEAHRQNPMSKLADKKAPVKKTAAKKAVTKAKAKTVNKNK